MPNVGLPELAIVLIIALVIFGPRRLPELGRSLGSGMREFKNSISGGSDGDSDREPREIEVRSEEEGSADSAGRKRRTAPEVAEREPGAGTDPVGTRSEP